MTASFVTHGRHCPCSACAKEDWTRPDLAPCGIHGVGCPNEYAPVGDATGRPDIATALRVIEEVTALPPEDRVMALVEDGSVWEYVTALVEHARTLAQTVEDEIEMEEQVARRLRWLLDTVAGDDPDVRDVIDASLQDLDTSAARAALAGEDAP